MEFTEKEILRFRLLLCKELKALMDNSGTRVFSDKEVVDIAYGYKDEVIINYMNTETPQTTALRIKTT